MSRRLHDIDVSRVHARSYLTTAPDHGLSELAVSEGVALTIVGTSRAGSVGDALPGGTGARLLHEGACAVAVVPPIVSPPRKRKKPGVKRPGFFS